MRNLKNDRLKTAEMKVGSSKGWRMMAFALVLVAAFAALFAAGQTSAALADAGGVAGHMFNVTFTKWITAFPNMAGVVGGDVGAGTFAGEILHYTPGTVTNGNIAKIEALYHVNGSRHSFSAHVYVTENDNVGTAVITGRVTQGWLEDASVTGGYKVLLTGCIQNSAGTPCFQGTLQIDSGSEQ